MPLAGDHAAGEACANVFASLRAALGLRAVASPCGRFAPPARAR
jgi:hypothetical protein